jgi:uncharacterized MAPEG superfamily protein
MSIELTLLLLSLPLFLVFLLTQSILFNMDHGAAYAATARDIPRVPGERLGRAERALRNFLETWPAFIILAVVAHLAAPGSPLVFWGAIVWLVARAIYLPLYLGGVVNFRSLAWIASVAGLVAMFIGVLF